MASNELKVESRRYDAFISYRHVEPDKTTAVWLHQRLETYSIPGKLQLEGKPSRLKRVFRDEAELEAASNLNDHLKAALDDSDSLVVVCSSRTAESKYVLEEIEYFRERHSSGRVFVALIDGEPPEVFPEVLRRDGFEPLAVDLRPATVLRDPRAKQDAFLRLVAAIAGCRFDDLRQRHLERERRRRTVLALSSLFFCMMILALVAWGLSQQRDADKQKSLADQQKRAAQQSLENATASFEIAERQVRDFLIGTVQAKNHELTPSEARQLQNSFDDLTRRVAEFNRLSSEHHLQLNPRIRSLLGLAQWRLATITSELRSPEEALPMYGAAVEMLDRPELRDVVTINEIVDLKLEWGGRLAMARHGNASIQVLDSALKQLQAEDKGSLRHARLLGNLALGHMSEDRLEEATSAFLVARGLLNELRDAIASQTDPKGSAGREKVEYELAGNALNLGGAYRNQRDFDSSLQIFNSAIEDLILLAKQSPRIADDEEYAHNLGLLHSNCSMVNSQLGNLPEALVQASHARELFTKLPVNSSTYQIQLGRCYRNLSLIHQLLHHPADAHASVQKCFEICEKLQRDGVRDINLQADTISACESFGFMQLSENKLEEARQWLERAAMLGEELLVMDKSLEAQRLMGSVLFAHGMYALHAMEFETGVRDLERSLQLTHPESPTVSWIKLALQECRAGTDDYEDALEQTEVLLTDASIPAAAGTYGIGVSYANASRCVRGDQRLTDAEQAARSERYAERAVELIGKAQALGYFSSSDGPTFVQPLKDDPLLKSLRERPDFKRLLQGTKLEWRLTAGQHLRYRVTMDQDVNIVQGLSKEHLVTRAIYDLCWKVRDVDSEGHATIIASIVRIRSQRLSGTRVEDEFDSASSKRLRGPQGEAVNLQLESLMGQSVTFSISPQGHKTRFLWSTEQVSENFGEIGSIVLNGLFFRDVTLPETPIRAGESWTVLVDSQFEDVFALADGRCRFKGEVESDGRRLGHIEFQVRQPDLPKAEMESQKMEFKAFEGTGEQSVDLQMGLLERHQVTKRSEFEITQGGESASFITCNTIVIERQPDDALHVFSCHQSRVSGVAFVGSGDQLLTTSFDGSARLWDIKTEQVSRKFDIGIGLFGGVTPLASLNMVPGDGRALICRRDGISVLDPTKKGKSKLYSRQKKPRACVALPDGKTIFSGGHDSKLHLWDINTHESLVQMKGDFDAVWSVATTTDGKTLASGCGQSGAGESGESSDDHSIRIWDAGTGQELQRLKSESTAYSLSFTPDGLSLWSVHSDNAVRLWQIKTGDAVREHKLDSDKGPVAISPDGKCLACGNPDGSVDLINLLTGQVLRHWEGHAAALSSIAFSPSSDRVMTGGGDLSARVWDVPGEW